MTHSFDISDHVTKRGASKLVQSGGKFVIDLEKFYASIPEISHS